MGSAPFKERIERGASSGIFTGDGCGADDWDDVTKLQDKLAKCRSISLANNKFKKPIPRELVAMPCFMTSLRVLDLSKNGIPSVDAFVQGIEPAKADPAYAAGLIKSKFSGVPQFSLEKLDLSGNAIATLPPLFLVCMPKLKELNLSRNQIRIAASAQPAAGLIFCFGASVVSLDLEGNGLTALPLAPIQCPDGQVVVPVANLQSINVTGNAIAHLTLAGHPAALLRSVSAGSQQQPPGLRSVDPELYSAPKLLEVVLDGNAAKERILTELRATEQYASWVQRRASTVNRQLAGGADAQLAE